MSYHVKKFQDVHHHDQIKVEPTTFWPLIVRPELATGGRGFSRPISPLFVP